VNTAESKSHPSNVNFGSVPVDDLLRQLETAPLGLTERSATDRWPREKQSDRTSRQVWLTLRLFAAQFRSSITLILIAAAILSAFLGDLADMAIILAIGSLARC
jgi:Mg2+-importing ATPase